LLPDAVFARALASSMCRALKIDAAPILERLPSNATPRLQPVEQNINMPFHAPGERVHGSVLDKLSKPVVLVVLALLVAALVMIFFPSMKMEGESAVSTTEKEAAQRAFVPATAAAIAVPPAAQDKPPPDAAMALPQQSPNTGLPLVASAQIVLPSSAGNSTVAADTAVSVGAALPAGGVSSGLVVLKAKGTSWVEVTDGNGVIQVRKTLAAGEAVGASGVLPLSVVVGRADNTEVQVRGKDYDLSRIVKDNVARFEVK
jgi:cytoskeleton protein RodZ